MVQGNRDKRGIDYLREVSVVRELTRHSDSLIGTRIALDARIELLGDDLREVVDGPRGRVIRRIWEGLRDVRQALDALLRNAESSPSYSRLLHVCVDRVYPWLAAIAEAATDMVDVVGWEQRCRTAATASRKCILEELGPRIVEIADASASARVADLAEQLHARVIYLNRDLHYGSR
jgi:hypothetical protein